MPVKKQTFCPHVTRLITFSCLAFVFTASTNALNGTPEPAEAFRLGAGDIITVVVWKQPQISETVTIRPDGRFSFPLVGELVAEGLTPKQLQNALTNKLKAFFTDPLVAVIVAEINSAKIVVSGKVRKPNTYVIRRETTVLDAIALAGGLREDAPGKTVVIFRMSQRDPGAKEAMQFDFKRLIHESGRILLRPLDTVYVN
jgi:polysaccharide biosynthesis/export protein